jgi:hypothetical protein
MRAVNKKVVPAIPLGFATGAISGFIVAGVSFYISATIGDCTRCCPLDAPLGIQSAIAGIDGAAYGAAFGVVLVAVAAVALPRALARTSALRLILFLVSGAFVGSLFSWIMGPGGHACGQWAPLVVKPAHLGTLHLFYRGPHLSVVLFTALWFFAGLGGAPKRPAKLSA